MKKILQHLLQFMPYRSITNAGATMKKMPGILLLCILLMLNANLCFAQGTVATAENFTVNSTANSTLGGGSNQDHWYKLITTADGDIGLSVTGSTTNGNSYLYVYLYDADAVTGLSSTSNFASNGAINFGAGGLGAGTYYVLIHTNDAFSNTYSITNTLTQSSVANDVEQNGSTAQAITMAVNSSKTGHIAYRTNGGAGTVDSDDYYKITTTADGDIGVSVTGDRPAGYIYLYLYDNDGITQLGTTSNYVSNGAIAFTVGGLAAGTYYIRIWEPGNSSYTGYTLTNSLTTSSVANDAELNDYFIQSNTINLAAPKTGHIGYRRNGGQVDGSDYYKLVTTNDGDITVTVTGDRNAGYIYIYLYDKDTVTQLITTSNYVANGPISFTQGGLAAGTYYVLVYEPGNPSYTGYTVTASLATAPNTGDAEPNDNIAQASAFPLNGTVSGHIAYRNNGGTVDANDYYKIITTQDGDISLSVTGDRPAGYIYIYLYDNDGVTQLGANSNYVSNGTISFTKTGLAAGTYYALVFESGNASYSGYTLTNTFTPAPYNNDVEANNTMATASLLNLNPSKSGHIAYRYNGGTVDPDDYWKIIMNTTDSFHVVLNISTNNSNGYVYIYLLDGNGTQIYAQSDYTNNRSVYDIYYPSLAAGTYYLRISEPGNVNFCSYTIPVFHVPCYIGASVITAGGPTTFCQGGSVALNTTATFTAYGQSNNYSGYLWSNNATSQNITATTTGSYSVTATDVDGCPHASNVIPVTVNPVPAAPTISTGGAATTFCQGGSVTLTSSAATGNIWSTGATTQSITVTASGNYTVTTTANGCTSNASAATVVTVNPLPSTPTIQAGGATTFCAGGSVTLTASAATSWLWSNGATTQSIIVNASGNYTVTVKNANGCSSAPSAATAVTVNPLPATPTISTGGAATTFCAGGSVTLTSSAATGNTWSTGATTQSIIVNTSGNYTVTVTSNGCSATSAATVVTVNPLPTVTLSQFTAVCSTDAAFALSGGSPAGGTYSGTGVSGGQFNPATAGVGSFPITYAYTNANGCSNTATQSIVVNNCTAPCNASISAGGPITFCAGGNVVLTASAGASYLWSNGATTQSITVSTNGSYSCAVTNANQCTATSNTITVTVNALPSTPTISTGGAATTFCAGGSITLTSSSATNNVWSNGATTQSITVNATGTYSVTVTNANNCSATSSATSVTVNPLPTVTLGQFTAKCSTDAAFTLTGGSPTGGTYSGTGVSNGQFNPATAGVGTFTITYSYTNANGCSNTATQSITVNNCNPQCTATITAGGATTFCAGGNVTLTASAGASWLWSNGATTQSITVSANGNYSCAVTNANQCTATSNTIAVTVNPLPTVTLAAFTAKCSTDAAFTLTGGSPAGGTYSGTGVSNGQFNPATAGVGTFTITYSYTNANGCSNSATQSITVNTCTTQCTATITAAGPTTFCSGGSVKLTASSGASYLWSNGSTASNITVTAGGSYTVKVTQANGCFATSAATVVTVNALPSVPTITAGGPTTFCTPGSVTLTSSAATSYLWSNGATTQSITVTGSGSFTVTVKNASGCSRSSSATIVTANNCGGTYCTANSTSRNKGYINNVKFRTINNTSGWNGGYGNFTNLTANVSKMVSYSISVTPGYATCNTYPLYTRVWIDWNHDGDFNDAGELVFAPYGSSTCTRNGSVSVPCNALCGSTRMRVEMRNDCNPSPCGTFTYGEVEDYTINVACSGSARGIQEDKTDDIILSESFTVYPNPVSDEMMIRRSSNDNTTIVDADAKLIVRDMNGKIMLQSTLTKSTEMIDVRRLPSGIYVVQIKTVNGTTTSKVVISH
ncbi:MAG: GEVED domain-containing protein [Ferruginibacter sp.]